MLNFVIVLKLLAILALAFFLLLVYAIIRVGSRLDDRNGDEIWQLPKKS